MRQTGYYVANLLPHYGEEAQRNIAYWSGDSRNWEVGLKFGYIDADFTHISHTPITPEKMAAIDEIIQAIASNNNGIDAYIAVKDILNKHKLI